MLIIGILAFGIFTSIARAKELTVRASGPAEVPSLPWVPQAAIQPPPFCLPSNSSPACPLTKDTIKECSQEKCAKTDSNGCISNGIFVDESCLCKSMNSTSCLDDCGPLVKKQSLWTWLNATCKDVKDWKPLPSNVTDVPVLLERDIPLIGSSDDDVRPLRANSTYFYLEQAKKYYYLDSGWQMPACVNRSSSFVSEFLKNLYNSTQLAPLALLHSNSRYYYTDVYLDLLGACAIPSSLLDNAISNCSNIDRNQAISWRIKTCVGASTFKPSAAWNSSLANTLMNSSYAALADIPFPSCVQNSPCFSGVNQTRSKFTSLRCDLRSASNCSSPVVAVELAPFCATISYESTCNDSCPLSKQRTDIVNWMDKTCRNVSGWKGLPDEWQRLTRVLDKELLPFHTEVRFVPSSKDTINGTSISGDVQGRRHCPSASAKLAAFAAVNIVMALTIPIFGRRTVVAWITRGRFGQAHKFGWTKTGPIMVLLHIAGNAISAAAIKSTNGFHDVSIGRLVLLWCTRPRLSWLVVLLVPIEADKAMYFSVTASNLFGETVLQLLAAASMGAAANYGRIQSFYQIGWLQTAPNGKAGVILYAGALLWLLVVAFALIACLWSIIGVNRQILAIRSSWKLNGRVTKLLKRCRKLRGSVLKTVGDAILNPPAKQEAQDSADLQTEEENLQKCCADLEKLLQAFRAHLTSTTLKEHEDVVERLHVLTKKEPKPQRYELPSEGTAHLESQFYRLTEDCALAERHGTEEATALSKACAKFEYQVGERLPVQRYKLDNAWNRLKEIRLADQDNSGRTIDVLRSKYLSPRRQEVQHALETEAELIHSGLSKLLHNTELVHFGWKQLTLFSEKLVDCWEKTANKRRDARDARAKREKKFVTNFSLFTVLGMLGCWIAQWLWWIGYIRVAADTYEIAHTVYCRVSLIAT